SPPSGATGTTSTSRSPRPRERSRPRAGGDPVDPRLRGDDYLNAKAGTQAFTSTTRVVSATGNSLLCAPATATNTPSPVTRLEPLSAAMIEAPPASGATS